MLLKYSLLAVFGGAVAVGCGDGGRSAPSEPVGTENPAPATENPRPDSQNPSADPQTPQIGGEEPSRNAQDPRPSGSPSTAGEHLGEGGASPGDN